MSTKKTKKVNQHHHTGWMVIALLGLIITFLPIVPSSNSTASTKSIVAISVERIFHALTPASH